MASIIGARRRSGWLMPGHLLSAESCFGRNLRCIELHFSFLDLLNFMFFTFFLFLSDGGGGRKKERGRRIIHVGGLLEIFLGGKYDIK